MSAKLTKITVKPQIYAKQLDQAHFYMKNRREEHSPFSRRVGTKEAVQGYIVKTHLLQ